MGRKGNWMSIRIWCIYWPLVEISIRTVTHHTIVFVTDRCKVMFLVLFVLRFALRCSLANSAAPDQTPQNAASDQGLHCFAEGCFSHVLSCMLP